MFPRYGTRPTSIMPKMETGIGAILSCEAATRFLNFTSLTKRLQHWPGTCDAPRRDAPSPFADLSRGGYWSRARCAKASRTSRTVEEPHCGNKPGTHDGHVRRLKTARNRNCH